MNKKVIVSLAVIGVVAAIAIGATIAYFSDTETSSNNIFTAGTIDLSVDHKYQSYNGIDCKTCKLDLVSDTTNMVVAKDGEAVTPFASKIVPTPYNSRWTAQNDPIFAGTGATWIWSTGATTEEDAHNNVTYTFEKHFTWDGPFTGATVNFAVGSDNNIEVLVNGTSVFTHIDPQPEGSYAYQTPKTVTIPAGLIKGGWEDNVLTFKVKNIAQSGSASGNPAGLLYAFKIDGNCSENYQLGTHCNLWNEKELTSEDKFWTFDDIKPGDWGHDLISLHVKTNDAKVCSYVMTKDTGILGNGINVFVWGDANGDGIYNEATTTIIYTGPISGFTGKMYDSTIAGNSTAYMGIAWCAGSVEGAQAVAVDHLNSAGTCSPATMGNEYQGETFSSDFGFYAVQARHNDSGCPVTMPVE